jgi:hypothetical protein
MNTHIAIYIYINIVPPINIYIVGSKKIIITNSRFLVIRDHFDYSEVLWQKLLVDLVLLEVYLCICICIYVYIYVYVYMYIFMNIFMYIYIHIYIYIGVGLIQNIRIYICIYIHIFMYMHILRMRR